MRDPWRLTLAQIDDLDDWEIVNVYFRPGDPDQAEKGVYWPVPDKPRQALPWQTPKQRLAQQWVSFAEMYKGRLRLAKVLSEAQIEARWQAYLERNPGLRQIEGGDA